MKLILRSSKLTLSLLGILLMLTLIFVSYRLPIYGAAGDQTIAFDSSTGTITRYYGDITDYFVSIPKYIRGVKVVAIGNGAFADCLYVSEIALPEGLVSIGKGAFMNCKSLSRITIPDSVTTIGDAAFQNTIISSITIPDGVVSIGDDTFRGCKNLSSVTIPDSVTNIGDNAFSNTPLSKITIPNGVKTIGYGAFADTKLSNVTIPDSVTTIGGFAFANCHSLSSITIPNSVTTIGTGAFMDSWLQSITIPDSVISMGDRAFEECSLSSIIIGNGITYIGAGTFKNCRALKNVVIGNKVHSIGEDAFYLCKSLSSITLPDSVKFIGDFSFYWCESLERITIPNNVVSIGERAFDACSSLKNVTLGNNLTSFGNGVFDRCSSLDSINVNSDNTVYKSVDGVLYSKNGEKLFLCPMGKTGDLTIPDGIITICEEAFYSCTLLESINIPDSVSSIEKNAFKECDNLKTVYYCGDGNSWYSNIFFNSGNDILKNAKRTHKYGDWFITIQPTVLAKGEKSRKCENCDATETEEIEKLEEMINPFIDVKDGKWYTESILWCYYSGYMAGTSEKVFDYKGNVTRAMFVTILAQIDGTDLSAYEGVSCFIDVAVGKWYSNAIEWAASNGYAAGLAEGYFGRKDNVSREQIALFFYTYSEKNGIDVSEKADLSVYTDLGRVHSWALDAMEWAVAKGLIGGTSETTLSPRDSATRAEIALIVKNYVETVKK